MNIQPLASQRTAEIFAIRNTEWSLVEFRALADRYADAVLSLQIAVSNENFAGVRSAYLSLDEIVRQSGGMLEGIRRGIEQAQQSQQEYMR